MASKQIVRWGDVTPVEMVPGLMRRTLGYTEDAMVVEFRAEPGADVPAHSHPHQQVGYVVSGEIAITIGGVTSNCKPGDSYVIPGDVKHSAIFLVESIVIDCFSPPREDYI
jgi:quercetin dioxygenase-like cupin family protein